MRKITVEEIDILVQANIEGAVKQFQRLVPEIRKQIKQISNEINNSNIKDIVTKIDISQINKQVQTAKKKIKEVFNPNDINFTIDGKKAISGISNEFNKLTGKKIDLGNAVELNNYKNKLDELSNNANKVKNTIESIGYVKYNENSINDYISKFEQLGKGSLKNKIASIGDENFYAKKQDISPNISSLTLWDTLRNKIEQIKPSIKQLKTNLQDAFKNINTDKLSEGFSKIKNGISSIDVMKSKLGQMPKTIQKISSHIKNMGNNLKGNLKHIIKYAGALLSIRGVYRLLSSTAQAWLSSQNAGAQQLQANIDYMKYAMGTALAPVIQFVTNLVYQLMKAIQSVVYALTGVNIFAKATASSMNGVARSTKKANKEAKQLAGIHDEINNVQTQDNSDDDSGSGAIAPSMDLSNVDSQMNAFAQKLYDFFKPLKESWDNYGTGLVEQVKTTAKQIGGLIASVWESFEKIITNGTVYSILENILAIIGNIAEAFANAWNYNGNGDKIVQNLANAFNNLLNAINNVVQSTVFQNWLNWCSDKFREMSEKIASINWQPLINALMQIGTTVGTVAVSVLNKLVDVFKWLVEHPDVVTSILSIVLALKGLSIISSIVQKVSALGTAFTGIKTIISGVSTLFSGLSLPLLAIAAVIGVVIYTIVTHFNELKASLSDTFSKFMAVYDEYIAPFVDSIVSSVTTLWNEHLKPLLDNLSELLMTLWNDILKPLIDWFIENILPVVVPVLEGVWNTLSTIAGYIADAISGVINVFKGIIEFISGVFSGDWNKAWQGIKDFFSGIWEAIKSIISGVWEAIKGIVQTAINIVKGTIETVFNAIKTLVINIWNGITTTISNVINGIKNTISNVLNSISTIWSNIWNGIKSVVTSIWNGIWGAIKGVINSILGGIESFVNGIIRGINFVLGGISKVANAVGSLLGLNPINLQLSTISLPRLAKGGVLFEETAFIGGEYQGASNNPEIVTPQNIMEDTFDKVMSRYSNNNDKPIYLTVNVSNKKLGQLLLDDLRDMKRQTGKGIEALVGG